MALPLRKTGPIETPLEHFELLHTPDQYGTAILWERHGLGKRWHKLAPDDPYIPALLRAQIGTRDGFITVNEFRYWRQVDNLKSLRALYVDIDRFLTLEDIADALHDAKLPWPSLIVWSGRGVHLYWLHAPMPAQVLPVWQRCQDVIIKALLFAGADPAAKDCARLLRLSGTINAKNGAVVQGHIYDPEPWNWHSLCDEILGPRVEPKAAKVLDLATARADRGQRLRTGSIYDWWHLVYRDLLVIAEQHWFGGIPEGHRDQFLFLSSVALSWFAHPSTLEVELTRRARTWTPGLNAAEVRAAIQPSIKRAQKAAAGETVLWAGQQRDPRYWYKRETLHGLMAPLIGAELAPTLRAIVSDEIREQHKRETDAKRDRVNEGRYTLKRDEYEGNAEQKRATARLLRAQGKTWAEVAQAVGYKDANSARVACR
ncbi:replication protein [Malikia spinosa]|uniref:Replication protein n=1 Tax=Malikia spinosa TaxID=86180 RepID=A0A2S9KA36_9BURK|nr:replication protein [Malikia spinosa]PRD67252.1 replication protein [Malikia spinosa]